ncbi:MAG: GHKL domain-containing protein, partial [Candidatus Hydrogenedentes bacterium]|nr:GHKL domain-containing protein [Candidatus Hydrogenedentota bacterium]
EISSAIDNAGLLEELRRHTIALEDRVAERTSVLRAVNRELEAFSYSVSHDLRAPLRSIDGFSQALIEDCAEQFDETGRDYLHRVRAASRRMGLLIDDLLRLSRFTSRELVRETVDLSSIAEDVIGDLRERSPGREVEVVIEPGIEARADPNLLRIALENLLENAWNFTSKRERALIEFGASQSDGEEVFFIKDNGEGFNMEYAGKLFGAFQRLHAPSEYEGTGIGLATVQRIVHRHGGRIWADAEIHKGATFFFTLP